MAPPMMAVHKIPEKEPWCFSNEFKANEKITDHMTEAKNPTIGKAYNAVWAEPKSAKLNEIIAAPAKVIST